MSLTLKKITDAIKAPIRKVWQDDLRTLFYDNPAAIVLWTYGARLIAGVMPPHNHADDGGEIVKGTLFRVNYGPYLREGSAGAGYARGIPLTRGTYTSTPKLLAPALVTLPGGISRLRGALVVYTGAAVGSTTLTVVLRSAGLHNQKVNTTTANVTAQTDLTWNAASGYSVLTWSWEGLTLNRAKSLKQAARCEFAVYLKGDNFGATGGSLVGAELWVDDDPNPVVRVANPSDPPDAAVTFSDIQNGKILITSMSKKLKGRWNSLMHGVLGRAPGLGLDAAMIDRLRKWRQRVKGANRHTGLVVPDSSGGYYSDGACLTYPAKASACFARQWGEDLSSLKNAAATQAQGSKIHSGGALDTTWLLWDYDFDLESGLAGIDISCALEPGNSTVSPKLYLHVGVFRYGDVGGTNLVKGASCSWHQQEGTDANGLVMVEIEPEENEAWVPFSSLPQYGFTQLRKKPTAAVSAQFETTNAYRVSQVVNVRVSHPGYQSDGVARPTGRYVLRVRFSLQSGGAYDANARLLAFEAIATKGY